jgi:hypothetical protein
MWVCGPACARPGQARRCDAMCAYALRSDPIRSAGVQNAFRLTRSPRERQRAVVCISPAAVRTVVCALGGGQGEGGEGGGTEEAGVVAGAEARGAAEVVREDDSDAAAAHGLAWYKRSAARSGLVSHWGESGLGRPDGERRHDG